MHRHKSIIPEVLKQSDRLLFIYDQVTSVEKTKAGEERETAGVTDLFEFRSSDMSFYNLKLDVQEAKEHDLPLTGYDWLQSLRIFVTADRSGVIRIWSDSKKFLREIKFPSTHPIDSVSFMNS